MHQLDFFSALQANTEVIDTEFKTARGGMTGFFAPYAAMAEARVAPLCWAGLKRRLAWFRRRCFWVLPLVALAHHT
jgi:hypothetical protein